jgi:hypothetical protein
MGEKSNLSVIAVGKDLIINSLASERFSILPKNHVATQ